MSTAPDRVTSARLSRRRGSGGPLSARRAELEGSLRDLLGRFTALGTGAGALSHAAEWLLDNSHLIRGALRQVGEDLPEAFGRTLPVMRGGPFHGQLRIAVLARQIRADVAGPLDLGRIRSAVDAWQAESTLTLGELWGLPALLRLEAVEDLVRSAHALLAGTTPAEGEQDFVQRIADDILTLRTLTAADWRPFVEGASRVEEELRQDPAGVYAHMDFATRDRYRKEVEELAKGSRKSEPNEPNEPNEPDVAREAVALAQEAASAGAAGRTRHVGFYLIDRGRTLLERRLSYRPPLKARPGRWVRRHPMPAYLGSIGAATLLFTLLPLLWAASLGTPVHQLAILGAALLLTAGTVAVSIESSIVTLSLRPRVLPRMGFEEDLPGDCRTLVAVPCMLTGADEIRSLLNALEVRFLGNAGTNLGFALLSDFGDAPAREMPGDAELLGQAMDGIRELGRRYQGDEGDEDGGAPRFFLLHRERRWNPAEGVWMGWERKRGKLAELDRLLAGSTETGFTAFEGDLQAFGPVRYVITLDADTLLPRGAAVRLAATLAHPLNQAELDADGRVVAGYTVLQPRVAVAPESGRTRFSRLFAAETGLDLYTRAVSDVYQDLFGIGIYAGKGIYDPAAFEASLAGRVPENALLSHDLFEGLHGRAGLVSDVLVLEDYPPNLLASLQRLHRWVRGDWQLLPWLLPRVPAEGGGRVRNRLPLIGLFMISDNLRRSLFSPALLLLFALGWLWLPDPWTWTAAGIATLALPLFLGGLTATWRLARGAAWMPTVVDAAWTLRTGLGETAAALAVLPCEAFVTLDAILRTLARLATRRHLLEWVTAAQATRRLGDQPGAGAYWRGMASAPLCALALGGLIAAFAPAALAAALPVLVLWVLSPWIAAWLGRVPAPRLPVLAAAERRKLRVLARRTWHFYERFVGPEDHWLPPDNFQEEPGGIVAHRTSPTNIGMLLLSTFTAYDLGYLDEAALTARLTSTLATLDRLEPFRGHVWNWYDTRSLAPLEPRYISTVDSGNLAACLLAVARGCEEAARNLTLPGALPGLRPAYRWGMIDVLGVLAAVLRDVKDGASPEHAEALAVTLDQIAQRVRAAVEPEAWRTLLGEMQERWLPQVESRIATLAEISSPPLDAAHVAELGDWSERIRHQLDVCRRALDPSGAEGLRSDLLDLARRADGWVDGMDFSFLFDRGRRLFRIGHNASTGEPDPNHYDLLASEARIASLLAIAKGDVPQSHWAFLGRPFTRLGAERTLLSWGGTMFEFLMPRLLMNHPDLTPLAESCRTAVHQQIAFGRDQGIPWGVSESGYSELDVHRNYRYRAFGVPGLGLKRDLGDRLVVAPYASVIALPIEPHAVLANLDRLAGLGLLGRYGLFEAIDFGPAQDAPRLPRVVSSYMAHHQGMILAALGNALTGDLLVRRFQRDPRIATVELLLHERAPRYAPLREPPAAAEAGAAPQRFEAAAISSWPVQPKGRPQMQLLSNGRYSVLVSSRGGGSSRWNDRVLVRGEADPSLDPQGTWIYVEDLSSGEVWTAGGGPRPHGSNNTDAVEAGTEVHFAPHLAELHSRHHGVEIRILVTVAPVDDLEVRLVRLVNETSRPRHLALTSYGEVVLAGSAEDRRHPAFGKLFVESAWVERGGTLVFRRRPRTPGEEPVVLGHTLVAGDSERQEPVQWETDRARFLGRVVSPGGIGGIGGMSVPAALSSPGGLSGTTGTTLDPVFALRRRVDLPPHGELEVAFLTAAGRSRSAVLSVLQRNRSLPGLYSIVEQARARARLALRDAGLPLAAARHVQELLSAILQAHPALRAAPEILAANRRGQPGLWPHGISGDRPILLIRARRPEDGELVREVLATHTLWRRHRVGIDLVILDEGATTYDQPMKEWLDREITRTGGDEWRDRPGGVFVVRGALLEPADLNLLEAVAAAVLDASRGSLEEQLKPLRQAPPPDRLPVYVPVPSSPLLPEPTPPLERPEDLLFDNGLGGFTPDGREYVIHLQPGQATPAAWIDVIANPGFGFLASESGGGYTWAGNSAEDRLTPWRNDPVLDTPGETLYLRDEETGEIWTPTRLPAGGDSPCQARFEAGSVRYLQRSHGLHQELRLSVPAAAPIKIATLRLTNLWQRPRRITATYYAEWVLGAHRRATAAHIVSEYDTASGALLARCSFPSGGERTAFLAADHPVHGLTADRADFLGDSADRTRPAGLVRIGLTGAVGPGLEPCAALQLQLDLQPGATAEVRFFLGQGADRQEALDLVARFRGGGAVEEARREVEDFWDRLLGSVQVSTPEPEIDLLVNRWLLHQSLSCRIRGRSALYQSSGAFGFRDQLQDVLAFLHAAPEIARAHILEAARHQFEEGDVLHWWHPPEDRGVRTLCSDDLLWLPYVVAQYVAATGDRSILTEEAAFLTGPPLPAGEAERYDRYPVSGRSASLYEHCLRAIRRGTTAGPHGLPAIGSCDWNDGMNRVGPDGEGESVWLAWFLYTVLEEFAPLCEAQGDAGEADRFRRRAETLRQAVEASAWDGDWYLRAWYDDGTPLGAAGSPECEIDLIAQAWAVLSGAADPERAARAMGSVWDRLVQPEAGLTLLLAPPFGRGKKDPGYIKAYPPGIRENGGQYSHAAAWGAWAFARLGDGDRAAAVLRTILPVVRTSTPEGVERYRVEPYAVPADIAGVPPHTGRGGWTWYTGTASWTWRVAVEAILGLRRGNGFLEIAPCIPKDWPGFEAVLKAGSAVYRVRVENPDRSGTGVSEAWLDGERLVSAKLPLTDDGREHEVRVRLAPAHPAASAVPSRRDGLDSSAPAV